MYLRHFIFTGTELDEVDIVFLLDHSKSIKRHVWPFIINFTASIATSLNIGLNDTLMGMILFGRHAKIHFNVRHYLDQASLLEAIYNTEYNKSIGTSTWLALELLCESSLPNGPMLLREGVPHIAVVVTDGRSLNRTATTTAAQKLHDANIFDQVYAIGIGSKRIDKKELKVIASDPSLAYILNDIKESLFTELQHNLIQQVFDICKLIALFSKVIITYQCWIF